MRWSFQNHRLVFLKHGDIYQQNAGYVLSLESKLFLMYTGLARNRIIIYNKVQNISYQIHVEGRYMYQSLGYQRLLFLMHTFTGIARIGMYIGGLWYQIFLSASQRSYTCPSAPVSRILYSEVLINIDILFIYVLCARILAQKTVIQMFSFHEPPTNQNEQGPNKYNHAMQKYLVQIPGQLFLVSSMKRQVSVDFSINGQISCAVIWCVLYG